MYGHLEGAGGNFARDPTGHLSIEAGIFEKAWPAGFVESRSSTEERYRRLETVARRYPGRRTRLVATFSRCQKRQGSSALR
jgi:hypothetical protein